VNRVVAPVVFLAAQLLLAGCADMRWYEPIAGTEGKAAGATTAEQAAGGGQTAAAAPAAEAPDRDIPENPYLRKRARANGEALRRFEIANAAMEQRDWSLAMSELAWLLDHHPKLSGPCLNMALAYQQQGELEQAEEYFRKTLQINRNNLDAYNQYAIFLREQGRFQEAEQTYLQALQIWDFHADTHRNIGVLYDMYMGDRERALLHFHRYQELTGASDRTVAGWIADLERRQVLLVKGA